MQAQLRARARGVAKHLAARAGFDLRRIRHPDQTVPVGDLRAFLAYLLGRGFEPGVVFDVGAFRGDVAELLHDTFACPVVMVEPLEEMAPSLARLTSLPNVTWVQAAAGREVGSATIYVDERTLDGTSMAERKGPGRQVPVTTLDALAAEHGTPGLVKIDVQGHELAVLDGGAGVLGEVEVLIVEALFVPHQGLTELAELVAYLAGRGFVVFDFAGFARRPMDGALGQADVVFVREGSDLRQPGWG